MYPTPIKLISLIYKEGNKVHYKNTSKLDLLQKLEENHR
jgi:hypothetical protein